MSPIICCLNFKVPNFVAYLVLSVFLYRPQVQDFTQSELYLLTNLSRDPNNLMLAGDTAQSIAVGVGFRFTDVRQIFYESFGGIEPTLLQLTHNYRSHAGILRLAACVVELLYFFFSDSLDRLPPDLGLFTGPKPVIMEAESPEELVLMLDGSKRETSRIEFGAHQVVIVRSEEAKQALPDEFGVDKDWVMTVSCTMKKNPAHLSFSSFLITVVAIVPLKVQESKGLEFDDVLLYNFFTDSVAGELWRVVSNYTEKDIVEYYNDESVKSSGVSSYDWEEFLDSRTRHLDFSLEKHKILESELKMLYTAITRARVNIFIAESDTNISRPMFEYFTRRKVVDTRKSSGMDGIRVFGVGKSTIADWRERGEYYLQNAEGQRQKGCLRLAAKCFDNAGESKRRDFALALYSFVEMDDQQPRDKRGATMKKRLYGIAAQLLEAKDVVFLGKAALCLLRTGDHEFARSAEMFELYARIACAKRARKGSTILTNAIGSLEQQYFTYAAKLFERCGTLGGKRDLIIRAFRNYICSGTPEDLKRAAKLIEGNLDYLSKSFTELALLCRPLSDSIDNDDPTVPFRLTFSSSEDCEQIRVAVNKLAKIACRSYYSCDNHSGVATALDMIQSRAEKIQLLSSLEKDPLRFISQAPWSSHPTCTHLLENREGKPSGNSDDQVDVTSQLIRELSMDGKTDEVVRILEERGRLLEAAEHLEHSASLGQGQTSQQVNQMKMVKAAELKARYLRLVLESPRWEQQRSVLSEILEKLSFFTEGSSTNTAPELVVMTVALANTKINGADTWKLVDECQSSVLWRYDSIMMAVEQLGFSGVISQRPDCSYWQGVFYVVQTVRQLHKAAIALRRTKISSSARKADDAKIVAQVEAYYELKQNPYDPTLFTTTAVTNMKLRQAFLEENDKTFQALGLSNKLVVELSQVEVHSVLAWHLYSKASKLLLRLEKHLSAEEFKSRPCESVRFGVLCKHGERCNHSHGVLPKSAKEHFSVLQAQMLSLSTMKALIDSAQRVFHDADMGKVLRGRRRDVLDLVGQALVAYLIDANHFSFCIAADSSTKVFGSNNLVWRHSTLQALAAWARENWRKLRWFQKQTHLTEVIRFWRILALCEYRDDATSSVEQALYNEEKRTNFAEHMKKNKKDHFLETKEENPDKVQLFSRLWTYAVDNIDEDMFKSISLTETLIERTSTLHDLKPLYKSEQVSLLEVNAIAIFSAISLRYSEASNAQDFYMVMPEKIFMYCYLQGEGASKSRGFGIPIRDAVESACHKNYFECFALCCEHLEKIADIIIKNELLRWPKKDSVGDAGRFEKALCLSAFVCCNALLCAVSGIAMDPDEAMRDTNKLPSLPLCGNIKELVQKLRMAMIDSQATKKDSNIPQRVRKIVAKWNNMSTTWDLLQALDELLRISEYADKLVLCRLRQSGPQNVEVESLSDKSRLCSILNKIQFHEKSNEFSEHYKHQSQKFLFRQTQQKAEATVHQDLSTFSRKSDERTALLVIERYVYSWREKSKRKKVANNSGKSHFQTWKETMGSFIGVVKAWLIARRQKRSSNPEVSQHNPSIDPGTLARPLNSIPNLWNDENYMETTIGKWNHTFTAYSPVFDGIECSYCGIIYDNFAHQNRYSWAKNYYLNMMNSCYTVNEAATQYNLQHFNTPEAPCPFGYNQDQLLWRQHPYDAFHLQHSQTYVNHREAVSHAAAQLDTSFSVVKKIIEICDQYHQISKEMSSWYLNIGEEGRNMLWGLENLRRRMFEEALPWPPKQNVSALLGTLQASSRDGNDFLIRIQMEETNIAQDLVVGDERRKDEEGEVMGHPLEL